MSARRYSVVWTAVALADVERLAAYVVDESPGRADAILERVISRAESLGRLPERGRMPPELRSIGDQTWRELQERPWRILYRIAGPDRVEIHGVIDGRRNLMDVLLERILGS
jgi:toxin ParE1/3/4